MRTDAIILDFDGTLVDTETAIFETWRDAYRDAGSELDEGFWRGLIGRHSGFDPAVELCRRTGLDSDPDAVREPVIARIWRRCAREPLRAGVGALLDHARELGLPLAVASSSTSRWVEHWLEAHGIRERFRTVVCRDHVAETKPAPDLFVEAGRRLGVAPAHCLVVEDSAHGVEAARRAGMPCIGVPHRLTTGTLGDADLVLDSLDAPALHDFLRPRLAHLRA